MPNAIPDLNPWNFAHQSPGRIPPFAYGLFAYGKALVKPRDWAGVEIQEEGWEL
jgi:hypothetical protein